MIKIRLDAIIFVAKYLHSCTSHSRHFGIALRKSIGKHQRSRYSFGSMRRIHHTLLTALTALLCLATGSWADTTNRALQVSPVPGVFVGGVGLLCASGDTSAGTAFFLLTRDRETAGSALFDNDDVTYAMMSLTAKTPSVYRFGKGSDTIEVDRRTLVISTSDITYDCALYSISDLHKAAANHLGDLLGENKI